MAISYVNKSAFASGTAALSVGAVANVVVNDLILLFAESANELVATPTGFTQVPISPVSTGTAATAGATRLTAFYQWATGADTTTAVADSGNHTCAIKLAYRGVDLTTPFDTTPVSGIKATASTSSSFPSITTITANAWVLLTTALDLDAASTATTSGYTNANLTGITERHDQTVTAGLGGGLVLADGIKATAGATGATTATVTSTIQVYLTIALRPAPVTQTLNPSLFTSTNSFFGPTVTPGSVTLSPSLFSNTNVFYSPTVTQTGSVQTLNPSLFTNSQTFFSPTVSPGSVTLSPSLFTNVNSFPGPAVIPGSVTLAPNRYDNTNTFFVPTVSVGAVTVRPSLFTNTNVFYPPVVSQGAIVLSPQRFDNVNTFFGPQLNLNLTAQRFDNVSQIFSPTVTPGPIELLPPLLVNDNTFFSPSVLNNNLSIGDYVAEGYVTDGYVEFPFFNINRFFVPTISKTQPIYTDLSIAMLSDIWTRLGLNTNAPVSHSASKITAGTMNLNLSGGDAIQCHRMDTTHIPLAVMPDQLIADIYKRLGLDTDSPLVTASTQITAGDITLKSTGTETVVIQRL